MDRCRGTVNAVFVEAFKLACVLEQRPVLRDGLAGLRQRHARRHAAQPWCWLRFFWERHEAFDILCMLDYELRRWQGSTIITPDQLRCERWRKAAQQRLMDLMKANPDSSLNWSKENPITGRCSPGFNWLVQLDAPVDVNELAQCILRSVKEFDEDMIAEELANEFTLFSQWVNQNEAEKEPGDLTEQELDQILRDMAEQEETMDPAGRSGHLRPSSSSTACDGPNPPSDQLSQHPAAFQHDTGSLLRLLRLGKKLGGWSRRLTSSCERDRLERLRSFEGPNDIS